MINFVDAGGKPNDQAAASANLTLLHNLIANTNVANPGGIDYWAAGPHIYFPPGQYWFSGPIRIRKAVRLTGSAAGTRANYTTMFRFASNTQGLILDNFDTDNLAYLDFTNRRTTGAGTVIEGINFRGSATSRNEAHGLLIRAFAVLKNVQVSGFGGHGIYVKADLSTGIGGQASNTQFYVCGAENNAGSGLKIEGGDANIIQVVGGDFTGNGDWGVEDQSFLGCTFTGVHTTQNAQPNSGFRGGTQTHLVTYPHDSGQVWAIRQNSAGSGSTQQPGTNENVWTRYYGSLTYTPPTWFNGIAIRPGGPFLTSAQTAWSVWTGCYSEGNQGPSQMGYKAILIGGDQGSGVQATNNAGTGQPIWMDAHNGELDLKSNLRTKGIYLGQNRSRATDAVGMKMSAASAAPVASGQYTVKSYMDYTWEPGDIVWNQARTATQTGVTPPLGWRCIAGPSDFEEIPFPTSGGGSGTSGSFNDTVTITTENPALVINSGHIKLTMRSGGVTRGYLDSNATNSLEFKNSGGDIAFSVSQDGQNVRMPLHNATTSAAANMVMDTTQGNRILRSTSSRRYKQDIQPLDGERADKLLEAPTVTYRSRSENDDPKRVHWGLIAEDLHDLGLTELVTYNAEGEPDAVQYERVVVGLLHIVKAMAARLESLEQAIGTAG